MIELTALAELVQKSKDGDNAAFELMYRETVGFVRAAAWEILHDNWDVEEAVQDTYARVYLHLHSLRDDMAFLQWLRSVAINTSRSLILQHNREAQPGNLCEAEVQSDEVEDWLTHQSIHERVHAMLADLPEAQRRTAILHYFNEVPLAKIAAMEGCPINTVKSRLRYAREALRLAVMADKSIDGMFG